MIYDVAIIGSGIVGASIARCLSRYNLQICLLEKENDVSCGTSKANSGIIHSGYDPEPGTLMAKLNVEGCRLYPEWAQQLHFDYKNIGSLVLAFSDKDLTHIKKLYERGLANGVEKLKLLNAEELKKIEPHVNPEAIGALLAETAGIISPYQATWAIAENAVQNGVNFLPDSEVHSITPPSTDYEYWTLHTGKKEITCRYVVNAAGLFADEISRMAGARNFIIMPRRGEYFLLDSNCSSLSNHTLFQTPNENGKGVLVTPTVDGNILVGPTADDSDSKIDTSTTTVGQNSIFQKGELSVPDIPRRNIINSFSGIRALAYNPADSSLTPDNQVSNTCSISAVNAKPTPVGDFIIEEDKTVKGFINVAGICSPGLTAAPAIGEYVVTILKNAGLKLVDNTDYVAIHKGIESFKHADDEQKKKLIETDSLYGRIICRCEMITEAEIVKAIHSPVGARDLDGVKRRTRAGMGRCQGGFCTPRITEIISRELNIPMTSVTKSGGCSFILNSQIRSTVYK